MNKTEIFPRVDHTLLAQTATWPEIKVICDDAITYGTASVCIPPSFVKEAADYVQGRMKICTVIGFPNGYNTTAVKAFETQDAINNGADEIDMVINIGDLKAGKTDAILNEIKTLKQICGDRILKVIIETDLLTKEEIVKACEIIIKANADFAKTSTGFVKNGVGAKIEDIALMFETLKGTNVQIKASGGIKTKEQAIALVAAGATRLGTSSGVEIVLG